LSASRQVRFGGVGGRRAEWCGDLDRIIRDRSFYFDREMGLHRAVLSHLHVHGPFCI
jgi:hypothetical protein